VNPHHTVVPNYLARSDAKCLYPIQCVAMVRIPSPFCILGMGIVILCDTLAVRE